MFKHTVDALANPGAVVLGVSLPFALIAGYGVARVSSSLFNELRNVVFARVRFTYATIIPSHHREI